MTNNLKQGIPFGSFVLSHPHSFLKEQDSVAVKYYFLLLAFSGFFLKKMVIELKAMHYKCKLHLFSHY